MLRLSRFGTAICLGLVLSLSACGPKGSTNAPKGSTNAPKGTSQEDLDAMREQARKNAMATGLIDQARVDINNGNYVSAQKRAEEALENNPNDADAYGVLGAAFWRAGEYEQSTKAYRDGVALDAGSFPVVIGLARNLQASAEHEEAIRLSEGLIALESKDFNSVACQPPTTSASESDASDESDEDSGCEVGWCDPSTKMCAPNRQVGPRLQKLWSQYLLMDVENGIKTAEELFIGAVGAAEAEGQLRIAASYRDFMQAFAGTPDLMAIEGDKGSSSLGVDTSQGLKYTGVVVGGEFASTVIQELQNETRIHSDLAKTLKLKELGKVKPAASNAELAIVLIPELKIGDLVVKNVPALVDDLSIYSSIGEVPGLSMGRQLLHRFGALTFDYAGRSIEVSKAVPSEVEGATESPLMFMDTFYSTVPVTKVGVDGSTRDFWAWFGGIYPAVVGITQKAYLKGGAHRPSDLEAPEDADRGLKMVYVEKLKVGELEVAGVGGLVFVNNPADAGLDSVTVGAGFELGGYLNFSMIQQWKVTYVLQQGKMYLQAG